MGREGRDNLRKGRKKGTFAGRLVVAFRPFFVCEYGDKLLS
jgi:hypothetical protein